MPDKLKILYITDVPSDAGMDEDPYYRELSTLDAVLQMHSDFSEYTGKIDLLIFHPIGMNSTVFNDILISKMQNPYVKTIVISDDPGNELFLQSIDIGVDKYLLQPIHPSAVKKVSERLIKQVYDEKEAKKALLHTSQMFRAISTTSLSARMNEQGIIVEINDLLGKLLGYSVDEIVGMHWLRFVERRFWLFLRSFVREKLRAGEIYRGVIEFTNSDTESFMVDTTLYSVQNSKGEIEEIVFIGHNLSEINRAILMSIEQMIDHDTSLAVLFNHRHEALAVNPKFLKLGGDKSIEEFFATCGLWSWMQEGSQEMNKISNDGTQKEALETVFYLFLNGKIDGRIVLVGSDREKMYYTIHSTSIPNPMIPSEKYHILYFVDVTHQERIKEEKLSDAKLMSVGRLAAAITHELNTPITYIKGNLELLKWDCEDKFPEVIDVFKPIEEGIERIELIVNSMYEFAGTGKEEVKLCNIHMTLVYALRIILNRSKHIAPIQINGELFSASTSYNLSSCLTMGVSNRLEQVWIIIINNALDEFEKGTIAYENRRINVDFHCNDDVIKVTIRDNAGGIPESMLEGIFNFAVGGDKKKSMGIGLNVAKAIINKHGGDIYAYNHENGAVFEIVLKTYRETV